MRIQWGQVLVHAAEIVRSYDTGVTLRQLFYRLVADGTLPNRQQAYKTLSARTTEARRDSHAVAWASPSGALSLSRRPTFLRIHRPIVEIRHTVVPSRREEIHANDHVLNALTSRVGLAGEVTGSGYGR
jgi:hypothetical protein